MSSQLAKPWHSGWLAAWLAAALIWVTHAWLGWCDPLEQAWGRTTRAVVAVHPAPGIAIVAIDDASLAALGAWPWPRERHARLIDQLTAAGVRRVIYTVPFVGTESREALHQLERIASAVNAGPALPQHDQLLGLVQQSQVLLDGDGQLAQSIAQSQRTVLALRAHGDEATDWPPAQLAAGAVGIGHVAFDPDVTGVVKKHALQRDAGNRRIPSVVTWAVASAFAPNAPMDLRPFWRPADRVDIPQLSAAALMNGKLPAASAARLAGGTVFVGPTAAAVVAPQTFIDAGLLYPVQAAAQAGSALATDQSVTRPPALVWILGGAGAVMLLYLLMLPRFGLWPGIAVTGLLTVVALLGSQVAMSLGHIELPVMALLVGLLAGHATLWWTRLRTASPAPTGILPQPVTVDMTTPPPPVTATAVNPPPAATEPMRLPATEPLPLPVAPADQPAVPTRSVSAAPHAPESRLLPIALADLPPLTRHVVSTPPSRPVPPATTGVHPSRLPQLGRFQLLRELGRGAMGRVYLAETTDTGETVAVKTLALSREFDGVALREARERFKREAIAALRLRHPGIVRLVDAGEDQGYAWIAMELLHGHDLVRHTQPTQLLPVPEVLAICACVADALAHAHAQGVVHRDIKPANVMYEPRNGEVKVTDFGIARITDAARTRTGLLIGSPSYMSPEHLAGGQVDGRSDLYSLGVLLFQLLTGSLPLNGRSMAELMQAVAQIPAPDVRSLRPRLPEPVANIVALALEKRPELRYAGASEMAADLRTVRTLWEASAAIPDHTAVDLPIQPSVHEVAAAAAHAGKPIRPGRPVGHNQRG